MIDQHVAFAIIRSSRREDRAMLRSNPSARSVAEARPGAALQLRLPPSQPKPCFSPYAINLNPRSPNNTPLYWVAVGHMSRSPGLSSVLSFFPGADAPGYMLSSLRDDQTVQLQNLRAGLRCADPTLKLKHSAARTHVIPQPGQLRAGWCRREPLQMQPWPAAP